MSSYIQNYGFTKTIIQDNDKVSQNAIQWTGDYDGNIANINVGIDNDNTKEFVSMQLTKNDLIRLLGVQPIQMPLDQRLKKDFYSPITLEGALIKTKSRKHKRRHTNKRRKSYRNK
jgi:hypothetical protein